MRTTKPRALPTSFEKLTLELSPRAIANDGELDRMLAMIDRLMTIARLSKGQSQYLETLVQLVQVYEAAHHAIDTSGISGLATLKHLLDENGLSAADLARLLGAHTSMGDKNLKGERSLTVDHIRILAERFTVAPDAFIDRRRGRRAAA